MNSFKRYKMILIWKFTEVHNRNDNKLAVGSCGPVRQLLLGIPKLKQPCYNVKDIPLLRAVFYEYHLH